MAEPIEETDPWEDIMRSNRIVLSHTRGARAAIFACLALCCPSELLADDYPSRPIRIVVGFAPGGAVDVLARVIAQKMGEKFHATAYVENRAGANSNLAAENVARSPADGYSLLFITTSHALNAVAGAKLSFDPITSFAPITEIAKVPNAVLVSPKMGVSTLQDFIRTAKAAPGKYNYASTGVGGATHLAGESFKQAAGVNLLHVPYRGAGPALAALVSGDVEAYFGSVTGANSYVVNGQMTALAVASLKRSSAMPDVPTSAEAGLPDYQFSTWYGLLAPAKTPTQILAKLHDQVKEIMQLPDVRQRLDVEGAEPVLSTPDEFRNFLGTEISRLGVVVKRAQGTGD
jgi:tripartite-type tricarboxylate transporter receptor subunit TctC